MGSSAPSPPDPTQAAIAGIQDQTAAYPFEYLVNALAQTGQSGTLTNPQTGQPQTYNFQGLGTADVQNQVSSQMAQTLLDIQQGLGSQYIAQRLADLKQSDPQGYAAYGQLFDQIQQEASQTPPDMPLSQATQGAINNVLQSSSTLSPDELKQVQQQAGAQNVSTGITLGNAPESNVGVDAVNALDQQQSTAQAAADQYLKEGVTPSDITYRQIQQNISNEGAFANGQNPTAQFSSLSGAANGAAPNPNTGYQSPTLNESQGAQQGLNLANSIYGSQNELFQGTANPYLAGLNIATNGINTALNAYNGANSPYSSVSPQQSANVLSEYNSGAYTPTDYSGSWSGAAPATGIDSTITADTPTIA
jgi:hypothetical protein